MRLFAILTSGCTLPWLGKSSSQGHLSPSISTGTVVALWHDSRAMPRALRAWESAGAGGAPEPTMGAAVEEGPAVP